MKRALLLSTFFCVTSSVGWGSTCSPGTMASYLGAAPCSIGSLTFSNFSYTPAGTAPGAAAVKVTPDGLGFQFTGAFDAGPGETADGLIGFTVSGAISDHLFASMGGYGYSGDATVSVKESVSSGAALSLFSNSGGTVEEGALRFPRLRSLTVTEAIAVNGGLTGGASLSQSVDQFAATEPGSILLFASGLLPLAGYIRRRQRKAP